MSPKNVDIKEAIQLFFKNYANFNGRSTRSEYWWPFLAYYIVYLVLNGIGIATGLVFLPFLFALATCVPFIAVGIRRMHDVGKSGWYLLVPLYNLYLLAQPSDPSSNQYGDPAV